MTSSFIFRGQKTNGNLDATLDFINFLPKSKFLFRNNFKKFLSCSQRMNDSLGTILNFLFGCEKRMAVWV